MSEITIVYGPNRYKFDSCLKELLNNLPSSFSINRCDLSKKDSSINEFLYSFSSINLFEPQQFFIVEISKKDLLSVITKCISKADNNKRVIFYCPDLYIRKVKNTYKKKSSSKKKDSNDAEILTELSDLENLNLLEASYIYDIDEAEEFCHSLITSLDLKFKSEEDMNSTIEHLISCSQLTINAKDELAYIDCDTELEDIFYEQYFISNNLKRVSTYSLDLDEIDFDEIESLLYSTVNKTNSKRFMKKLFKCPSAREAGKLLNTELQLMNRQEIRNFIGFFRNILDQNLKMVYGEYYVKHLVEPITKGKLKVVRPEDAYIELCDICSDYTCTSETYINRLKLCLYKNFK